MANKLKNAIISVAAVFSALAVVGVFAAVLTKPSEEKLPRVEIVAKESVNASLDGVKGDVTLTINGNMPLVMSSETETTAIGDAALSSLIIQGGDEGGKIVVSGDVRSTIMLASDSATLTFKDLTFSDDYAGAISYITDYTAISGNVLFENCTFENGLRLKNGTNMKFVGCDFYSKAADRYSVWIEDGTVALEACTFKGYRGIKIHEAPQTPTDDVKTVAVSKCTFDYLSVKCGVAIGTVNAETSIVLKENQFIGCHSWDTVGSLEGIDGIYESDTPVEDYTLTLEGNEVRGTVSNIYYKAVIDGVLVDVFPNGYLTDEHITTYVQEKGATIAGLTESIYTGYDLIGAWYLDEACTVAFDGVIKAGETGDVYFYAALEDDSKNWTQNY